ncbi:hypothetical protein D1872_325940 [compost metagenome]
MHYAGGDQLVHIHHPLPPPVLDHPEATHVHIPGQDQGLGEHLILSLDGLAPQPGIVQQPHDEAGTFPLV